MFKFYVTDKIEEINFVKAVIDITDEVRVKTFLEKSLVNTINGFSNREEYDTSCVHLSFAEDKLPWSDYLKGLIEASFSEFDKEAWGIVYTEDEWIKNMIPVDQIKDHTFVKDDSVLSVYIGVVENSENLPMWRSESS